MGLHENVHYKKTGYHAECYRKCRALGTNAPPKNEDLKSKSLHARSKSTLANASSSTGVMPKIYIFCTKKDKKHNGSKQKLISVETGDSGEKIKKYATTLGDQSLLSKLGRNDFEYPERSIRQLQSKFKKQAKIKRQQSVQSFKINKLVGGGSGHYRWRCVEFKGRIQNLHTTFQSLKT